MNNQSPKKCLELLDEAFELLELSNVKEVPVIARIQVPEENAVYADYPSMQEDMY